ncbi:MAG: tetratricopeptide repeat protein [Betaproteobacteria bacterium]|nr:tetratricopeptide repeat protein [Betaproteobacteria bacterium]
MNLGIALQAAQDLAAATTSYRRAIALDPGYAAAHCNLGLARLILGEYARAEVDFRRALNLRPEFPEAWVGLADALESLGRDEDALAALDIAIGQREHYVGALFNASKLLRKTGRLEEAQARLREIPDDHPEYPFALVASAAMMPDQGRMDEAEAVFHRALELKPDYHEGYSNLLFVLNYHADRSAEEIFSSYRAFDERYARTLRSEWRPHLNDRRPARRLRVGYVSPDFCRHPCRHFIEPLLDHHDKSVVEVFAYAEVRAEDAVTARMKARVEYWVPTTGMSDAQLADRIRTDGIDILIDLAGHTHGNRLLVFARRPAPVSVTHLQGFGYGTGLSAIDWCFADALVVPEGSEHLFSEQPWRMSQCMVYRPAEGMGAVSSPPAMRQGQVTFGTLTRPVRINHRTVTVWAEIMRRVPGSRLRMDSSAFRDPGLRRYLNEKFSALDIAGERLEMGFHSPPWNVLREIDIGLDCFPHNSATTLFESLFMGVPFITLPARPSVGRLGSSILTNAGHPEWIAANEQEYVDKAAALAANLPRLSEIRQRLRTEMQASALMDEAGYVRKVEAAYREMWRRWCSAGTTALPESKQ